MDKTPWQAGQGITNYDLNNMSKDAAKSVARLTSAMLGTTGPVVTDFVASQTTTPSLSINLSAGQIYQLAQTDSAPIGGTFAADSTLIVQQGWADAQQIDLNSSGMTTGQSRWWLIEGTFEQIPGVRPGDPTGGLRGFWNADNPSDPLSGPDDLGGIIATVIAGVAHIQAIAGDVATTGSAIPPSPSAGYVPLFLIEVAAGQSAITNGEIMIAGPEAYTGTGFPDGYPAAPFLAGLLQSHHGGVPGQAPKINLATEVQGLLSYLNMLVSDQTPAAVGGNIVAQGIIPVFVFGTVAPNGNIAGKEQTIYANLTDGSVWYCKVTGSSSTAVWIPMSSVIPLKYSPAEVSGTVDINQSSGTIFDWDCTSGAGIGNLPPNPGDGTLYSFTRKGQFDLTINVSGTAGVGANLIVYPTETSDTSSVAHQYSGPFDLVAMSGGWYVK